MVGSNKTHKTTDGVRGDDGNCSVWTAFEKHVEGAFKYIELVRSTSLTMSDYLIHMKSRAAVGG